MRKLQQEILCKSTSIDKPKNNRWIQPIDDD